MTTSTPTSYAPAAHLAETLDVLAPNVAKTVPGDEETNRHRGDLYATGAAWRCTADVAAAVRADVKAAVAAGDLPGKAAALTYSVRTHDGSFPGRVAITVRHTGDDRARPTGAWARRPAEAGEKSYYDDGQVTRADVRELAAALSRMAARYTRTDTNAASDLHSTSCYVEVHVAGHGQVL